MSLQSWLSPSLKTSSKRPLEILVNDTNQSSPSHSSPKKRKFSKELSQTAFNWYVLDTDKSKWFCKVCREAKNDTAYAREHEIPSKTTNHARHAASQAHLTAVTRSKLKDLRPFQTIVAKQLDAEEQNMLGNFYIIAYHLAKRELPKSEFAYQNCYICLNTIETSFHHIQVTKVSQNFKVLFQV
ncbi:hypothetical protein LOTGIDRAFT_153151 [Lottia gigantea]|uniref:Uncharacterized protein n=1 Tax=Lottia gigantea TaxID=225164 RepID=V4AJF6_LOTGI|nr:hypothetical protein LOTGIDRAFT_153151 [Lottia gigantea]ESO93696.1 hypothetical protein LOTGIDRAFT_153151 [Lottia gigantea]